MSAPICTALLTVRSESHSGINSGQEGSRPHPLAASAEKSPAHFPPHTLLTPPPFFFLPLPPHAKQTSILLSSLTQILSLCPSCLLPSPRLPSFLLSIPSTPSLVNYCNGLAVLGCRVGWWGVGGCLEEMLCGLASRLQQTNVSLLTLAASFIKLFVGMVQMIFIQEVWLTAQGGHCKWDGKSS